MKNFSKLAYALVLMASVSLNPALAASTASSSSSPRSTYTPAPASRPTFTAPSPAVRSNLDSPRESSFLGMRKTDPTPTARVEAPKPQSSPENSVDNKPSYGMRRVDPSTTAAAPSTISPSIVAPSSAVANDNKPSDAKPSYGMRRVDPSTAAQSTVAPIPTTSIPATPSPSAVANDNKPTGAYGMRRVEPSATLAAPNTISPAIPSVQKPVSTVTNSAPLSDPVARQLHSQMGADSARKFAEDRKRAQMPATPVVPAEVARNDNFQSARRDYSNMDQYYRARSNAQDEYRRNNQGSWQNSSTWAQRLRPNYGPYDGLMLASIVANVVSTGVNAYSIWAYSHRNEGWYQNWHSDMQREASNSPDLQAKLNELDRQISDLTAKGAATEASNNLPPGWSPASAIAPEVFGGMLDADTNDTKPMVMADKLELPAPNRVIQPSTSPFDTVGMNKVSDHVDGGGKWAYMAVFIMLLCAVIFFYFSRKR